MSIQKTDLVGEYLREVELRLSGLPLLERRELLADLESHIATERERGVYSESEMIEVLRRLGSPEEVAAAAYWEAGPQPPRRSYAPAPEPPPKGGVPGWVIAAIVAFVVLFLIGALGLVFFARVSGESAPEPMRAPAIQAPMPERPDMPLPFPTE
jgi:uncharacterized membrane protein